MSTDPLDGLTGGPNLDALGDVDLDDLGVDLDDLSTEPDADEPDPFANAASTGSLEGDSRAEWDEIKSEFQRQDANQRTQFKNLYDAGYYFTIVYKTGDDADRGKDLLLRILSVSARKAGFGFYINGHHITRALERLAKALGIDISDIR